jgi:hypothetical protein
MKSTGAVAAQPFNSDLPRTYLEPYPSKPMNIKKAMKPSRLLTA